MRWDVRLHRWLGLALGGWFAFAGLTGAVLVFWKPIEELAFRAPALAPGAALPLEALVAAAQARHPRADAFRVFPAPRPGEAAQVALLMPEGGRASLHLDPASGAILGERVWRGALIHWIYDLHSGGVFGRGGVAAVGLLGLLLGALALLGLILWLRYAWRPPRESLWPRGGLRGMRRLRNLHRPTGFWLALPILLAGATGFGLAWPDVVRELVPPLLEAPGRSRGSGGTGVRIGLDAAAAAAEAAMPGWRTAWIELPETGAPPEVVVRLRAAGPGRVDGIAQVFVSLAGGAVKAVPSPPVERFRAWIMALHNGSAFGLAHQLAIVLLGLAPALLFVTGLLAWRRRRLPAAQPAAGLVMREQGLGGGAGEAVALAHQQRPPGAAGVNPAVSSRAGGQRQDRDE